MTLLTLRKRSLSITIDRLNWDWLSNKAVETGRSRSLIINDLLTEERLLDEEEARNGST